jgi:ParB/RepB/Spo0J family partition protein
MKNDKKIKNNKDIEIFKDMFQKVHTTSSNLFLTNIKNIAIDDLILEDNIRKSFDEETITSLANSIEKQGLLQPILVAPSGNGKYLVIAGQRRYLAVKKLNGNYIPCHIVKTNDKKLLQLVENLQRENLSLFDKAKAIYEKLCEIYNESVHEKIFSNILEYKRKLINNDYKPADGVDKKIYNFLEEIGMSVSSVINLILVFGFDKKTQEIIKKYDPPLRLLEVCYKYRNKDDFSEVFQEIIGKKLVSSQAEVYLKRKYAEQNTKKEVRKRYYNVVKSIGKKIDEIPFDLSLVKDKDRVIPELESLKDKIEILLKQFKDEG